MYLKGYRIKYENDKTITFPKWDFGGDRSHTYKIWNDILSKLRSLPINAYPLSILDLDKDNDEVVKINNQQEFEDWMKKEF